LHESNLDYILIHPDTHKIPYKMFHGEVPGWVNHIYSFG
jgi:hypothetical protein